MKHYGKFHLSEGIISLEDLVWACKTKICLRSSVIQIFSFLEVGAGGISCTLPPWEADGKLMLCFRKHKHSRDTAVFVA